tara:strand:+ start:9721 stop:10065 length:345 start_codon:yes stop_codon:yes gene_type:complete
MARENQLRDDILMCVNATDIHMEAIMRTNIEIDDEVVAELMRLTGRKTKRQVVDDALRDQLGRKRAAKLILDLQGTLEWQGDLDTLRAGRWMSSSPHGAFSARSRFCTTTAIFW